MIHLQDDFSSLLAICILLISLVFLIFQGQTIQMMYGIIAQELKSMRMENSHPQDYLNFYCLGNREEIPKEFSGSSSSLSNNGDSVIKQQVIP